MAVVAGVDSSTQSTKVELRDAASGRLLGRGRAPHPPTTPPRSEQDPASWEAALGVALDGALTEAGLGRGDLAAVSVAAQQHGLVVLDGQGRTLRPAKLWNDTESAPDARQLVEQLGAAGWAAACGSVPVASFTITKLAWLRRVEPDVWAATRSVLLPHDLLTRRLAGERVTDRGDASGTGYWSPAEGRWRPDLLALVDPHRSWADLLPRVLGPSEPAGRWGATVVGPGTGDNMAAALGLALVEGEVAVSVGTSGTVFSPSGSPTSDPAGAVAGFAGADGTFLPLVCTLNAARVTDAAARLLGVDHEGLDRLALAAPPGAGGLVLLPYLDGERTPDRPDATGLLAGIRSDVTREQLARAAVEGVACGLLDGLDALEAATGRRARSLVLVGGGARSAALRRVLADLSGRPVEVVAEQELVARGAAAQAAAALADLPPGDVARGWGRGETAVVEPGPHAAGDDVRAAYAAVRDAAGEPGGRPGPPPARTYDGGGGRESNPPDGDRPSHPR